MNISVDITGVKAFEKAMQSYANRKDKDLRDTTRASAINVERNAKGNVRVNHGRLRASIHANHSKTEIESDVSTNAEYAPFEEFGTGKHVKIPPGLERVASQFKGTGSGDFRDLVENIRDWASKKGIDEGAVWPIALKIAREGREGHPFLFPAWEEEKPRYERSVRKIMRGL